MKTMSVVLWAFLAFDSSALAGAQPAWIQRYDAGLMLVTNQVAAITLDAQGNILIAGSSTGVGGDYDYLTLKYSPGGTLLWFARHGTTNGIDQVRDMAVDAQGNVYVTGTSVTLKYGSAGTLEWMAPFAGRGLALDANAHVYVTGFSETDFATAKLDATGSNEWVRVTDCFQGGYPDHSEKVAVDEAGNLYVAGGGVWLSVPPFNYTKAGVISYDREGNTRWRIGIPAGFSLEFRQIIAIQSVDDSLYFCGQTGGSSFYETRLDREGTAEWTQRFTHSDVEGAGALVVTELGESYVTGGRIYNGFPYAAYATFKADNAGSVLWEANYDNGGVSGYHHAHAIALDGAGSVYVTGQSNNRAADDTDWATIKYSAEGREQWAVRYDGAAHRTDIARKIAVDSVGNVYVAGTETTTNGSEVLVLIKYFDLTSIAVQPDHHVKLQFLAPAGQPCRLQATSDFPNWEELATITADPDGIARFEDTNAPAYLQRFYRLAP